MLGLNKEKTDEYHFLIKEAKTLPKLPYKCYP